jgi:uncharacterized protein YerC
MYGKALLVVLATFAASSAFAAQEKSKLPLQEGIPYPEQRDRIQADLRGGETYAEITAENRSAVVAALGRIDKKLEGGTAAALSEIDKLAVFNDQELVNSLLVQAREDSRLICRRERPVGSNRPQNICISVAQRREARDNSQDLMRNQVPSRSPDTGM